MMCPMIARVGTPKTTGHQPTTKSLTSSRNWVMSGSPVPKDWKISLNLGMTLTITAVTTATATRTMTAG